MAERAEAHADLVPRPDDSEQQTFGYGHGGVPFLLLLFYLAFLTFFTWYSLEYQLPDYLETRGEAETAVEAEAAD